MKRLWRVRKVEVIAYAWAESARDAAQEVDWRKLIDGCDWDTTAVDPHKFKIEPCWRGERPYGQDEKTVEELAAESPPLPTATCKTAVWFCHPCRRPLGSATLERGGKIYQNGAKPRKCRYCDGEVKPEITTNTYKVIRP